MSKLIKVALLSVLLAVGLSASDFLSKVTNGAISDNSIGVKQLSDAEMKKVLGGYWFVREATFDFIGGSPAVRSYAFVVVNNKSNRDAGIVADEFNLGNNEMFVVKARYDYGNRRFNSYLQVYNFTTGLKVKDYLLNYKSQKILNEFNSKILGQ